MAGGCICERFICKGVRTGNTHICHLHMGGEDRETQRERGRDRGRETDSDRERARAKPIRNDLQFILRGRLVRSEICGTQLTEE